MAINIPTYTGEQAGGLLPKFSGEKLAESQEKMMQTVLETEKFKYGERKKEEAEFLKNVYIKPEYIISTAARTKMANDLKSFSDKWYKTNKQYKGILPFEMKVQMQNERALLESTQNDLLENMGRWKILNDAVVRDGGVNYDETEWRGITDEFLGTGQMPLTSPPVKGKNPYLYFQKNKVQGTEDIIPEDQYRGGVLGKADVRVSGTPEESGEHIVASILSDPALLKGTVKYFIENSSLEEKLKYLDVNKDKIISEEEKNRPDKNAILEWAKEKFSDLAIRREPLTWAKIAPNVGGDEYTKPSTTKLGGTYIDIFPGVQTTSPNQRTISVITSIDPKTGQPTKTPKIYSKYTFVFNQNLTLQNIKTINSKILRGKWQDDIDPGIVNAKLVLYDPIEHIFVIETTTGSESLETASRLTLEVPEENITGYENIPLQIGETKITVAGSRRIYTPPTGGTPTITPAKEETPKDWSKYQRK